MMSRQRFFATWALRFPRGTRTAVCAGSLLLSVWCGVVTVPAQARTADGAATDRNACAARKSTVPADLIVRGEHGARGGGLLHLSREHRGARYAASGRVVWRTFTT